jgi:hypothetical protein
LERSHQVPTKSTTRHASSPLPLLAYGSHPKLRSHTQGMPLESIVRERDRLDRIFGIEGLGRLLASRRNQPTLKEMMEGKALNDDFKFDRSTLTPPGTQQRTDKPLLLQVLGITAAEYTARFCYSVQTASLLEAVTAAAFALKPADLFHFATLKKESRRDRYWRDPIRTA